MHQNTKTNTKNIHAPVLLSEVLSTLKPQNGDTYLDLTAGYGGHAQAILEKTGYAAATLVDRDMNAVHVLQEKFAGNPVEILHCDFHAASQTLTEQGKTFSMILADLGVSSPHLDNASRGFSIAADGPLDMRMDESAALSAYDIVNSYDVDMLRDILQRYGEEPKAGKIARLIAEHRPIETTQQLAAIVAKAWPGHSRVHPATRTFQAIRIAVNDELAQLEQSLPLWMRLLAPEGRLAVITFHSLEDRIVKQYFKEHSDSYDAELTSLTHKPLTAGQPELLTNPRARSAKLRAVAKIKTKD
jgi:16S rRNA (cytosine1402-N4)-methyltransferase